MKINSINTVNFYTSRNTFKGSSSISEEYPKKPEGISFYEYEDIFGDLFYDCLDKHKEELYRHLDSITLKDGTSVSQNLRRMFKDTEPVTEEHLLLHKTYLENYEKIKEGGFDPTKINKTEYGPGFYFGNCEGALTIYSGVTCKINYRGRTARGKTALREYNQINAQLNSSLRDYLKIPFNLASPLRFKEDSVLRKFINEYTRNKIVSELGIDGTNVPGSEGYFIVFNPDAVKSIDLLRCEY